MASARRRPVPRSPVAIGAIFLGVSVIVLYLGFTKHIPFTHGFRVNAVFENVSSLRKNSPVRIAGVEVGKVKKVEAEQGTNAAVVTMELKKTALPLHADATAKIRPRIFLEGNFFVDLKPGTPGSPTLEDGDTIKVTQTSAPVQLDEVLTTLQSDTRDQLKRLLHGLNVAIASEPTQAQNADADPSARGQTAAESFNDAYADIPASERSTAQVLEALLGTQPTEDLQRLIRGTANTTGELNRNEDQLRGLITSFNETTAALASRSSDLQATIRELAPTLRNANGAFSALNRAFPPTRAFAREVLPGVRETGPTIDASFPWIAQTRRLMSPQELRGVAEELSPATRDLARLVDESLVLLPQTDLASKCARDVVLPAGDLVVRDEFTTGKENYKEFFYGLVGIAGEGQNFDGNGMYVRFQTGGGSQQVSLGNSASNSGEMFGNAVSAPLGNRPFYPGKRPPYRPDVPCYTQPLPDVNGPAAAKSAPGGQR